MTALPPRFIEDRALRDAARAVLEEDVARLRESLEEEGVTSRVTSSVGTNITGRIRAGANDVLEQAKQAASNHRGVLAVLIGAILLWLMRGPLLALIEGEAEVEADTEIEPEDEMAGAAAEALSPDAAGE
ncbi:MAG: hypothetical protein ACOVNS_01635 [Erythrobacter sp.]|jgi:hypothetical protein